MFQPSQIRGNLEDRDWLGTLPDEPGRAARPSLFRIVEYRKVAPVVPPSPDRAPHQRRRDLVARERRRASIAIIAALVVYALVIWATVALGISNGEAHRRAAEGLQSSSFPTDPDVADR